jgi:Domain of unknown function (DUF6259)
MSLLPLQRLRSLPVAGLLSLLVAPALAGSPGLSMQTERYVARFSGGALVSLTDHRGRVLVGPPSEARGLGLHRVGTEHWSTTSDDGPTRDARQPQTQTQTLGGFTGLAGAEGRLRVRVDTAGGDLVVRPEVRSPSPGVWGVSWWIGDVPLDHAVVVPGRSGVRLTAATPGTRHEFDYPMTWEAQLVIVEGPGHGFSVWSDDVKGRAKRLIVERRGGGWRIGLMAINDAPFDALSSCASVAWRLDVHEGDWRVPARRYRDWFEANLHPTAVAAQRPAWVKDIRACVIMGQNRDELEALPARFDPRQTLLYLPDWRSAGYDRNYPDYDAPRPDVDPFIRRAHALGFRVMLHVNYFGVDPHHPLFDTFKSFQVRDPWGVHERQWWVWDRVEPEIRFAYINPALKAWRDTFTAAMVKLRARTQTDALHLDQTLCIYNDHNGRVEGRTMLEGNLELHRQLREALPDVALSGEGLNEVTCRYEAFAQRHVWGMNHVDGTWDPRWLAAAHPVSSYLLRPYTVIYGYLGIASPGQEPLYAAWNESYEHWGVIPTLKPDLAALRSPARFARQFFDEVAVQQHERLDPDLDGPWPDSVAFPYRTASGGRATRTRDGRFLLGDREISRTVRGVNRLVAPGTIPGWLAYNERQLIGLDPGAWYPYFTDPRDPGRFHVTELPEHLVVATVVQHPDLALLRTRNAPVVVADLGELLASATCGTRPFRGPPREVQGPLESPDGALFLDDGAQVTAHPPYKGGDSGEAFARFTVALPAGGRLRLASDVALDRGAVGPGKSDGVTFGLTARAGDRRLHAELHNATAERRSLALDLTPLAGREAIIELTVGPGPAHDPSFDWARWHAPRIERLTPGEGTVVVAGGPAWGVALDARGPRPIAHDGSSQRLMAALPGSVFFLPRRPDTVVLPCDLARQSRRVLVVDDHGSELRSAPFAGVREASGIVGGQARPGLFIHPPDHGRTIALFPMSLPGPAVFHAWLGIRDGSKSSGVLFIVELNGRELARRRLTPGRWEPLTVPLDPPGTAEAGPARPVVLSLVTDSDGDFDCDWAHWAEPRLEPRVEH